MARVSRGIQVGKKAQKIFTVFLLSHKEILCYDRGMILDTIFQVKKQEVAARRTRRLVKMKEIIKEILLDNQQIAELVEQLDASLQEFDVHGQTLIRLKLSVEEVLLNFRDHFGCEKKARMVLRSRLGRKTLMLYVPGEQFDPTLAGQEEDDFYEHSPGVLLNIGLSPEYQYRQNQNIVQFPMPRKEINSALFLVFALVGAVILGLVGNHFDDSVKASVNTILTMFYDILFGLIGMFAAPMVFLTMITGVFEIGDISQLKLYGKRVFSGFMLPFFVGLLLCIALPFLFPLNFGEAAASGGALQSITDAIAGIFPSDFVSPFVNGDFAQVVVTATILGIGTLLLAREVPAVLTLIVQLNRIISTILDYLCMLIPVIIFVTVVQIIWSGDIAVIASAWMPILFSAVWLVVVMLWETLACAKTLKEKPGVVLKDYLELFIAGLTTASISACYSLMDRTACEALKSDKKTAGFVLPIGMMAFGACEFVEFLALTVYFGCVSGIEVTPAWLFLAVILSFIFSVALPPVAGGAVVVLSIMLALLNVPTTYIGVAGAVALLMDYPCTAVRATGVVLVSARISARQRTAQEK